MEAQKTDMMTACNGNKRKWDSESANMNEWRTKMSTQLHTTKQQVDKFLKEDLRRDQATGKIFKISFLKSLQYFFNFKKLKANKIKMILL